LKKAYIENFQRKITGISGPEREPVFTGMCIKLILVIFPEENHENLRSLEDGCVHGHVKKVFICNHS
jgi:hypothetical protein